MNRTQRHHEQASTFEEDISDDDLSQMTDSSIIKILRLGPRNARDRPVKAVVNFPSFNHSAFPPLSPTAIIARNSDLWSNDQKGGEEKKHPFGKILMDRQEFLGKQPSSKPRKTAESALVSEYSSKISSDVIYRHPEVQYIKVKYLQGKKKRKSDLGPRNFDVNEEKSNWSPRSRRSGRAAIRSQDAKRSDLLSERSQYSRRSKVIQRQILAENFSSKQSEL